MPDEIQIPRPVQEVDQAKLAIDHPGKLSEYLGSGKHAQTAIVYLIIKWSFIIGGLFSLIPFIASWLGWQQFHFDDVKSFWTIFIPLITLSLGYLFGKGRE